MATTRFYDDPGCSKPLSLLFGPNETTCTSTKCTQEEGADIYFKVSCNEAFDNTSFLTASNSFFGSSDFAYRQFFSGLNCDNGLNQYESDRIDGCSVPVNTSFKISNHQLQTYSNTRCSGYPDYSYPITDGTCLKFDDYSELVVRYQSSSDSTTTSKSSSAPAVRTSSSAPAVGTGNSSNSSSASGPNTGILY